MDFVQGRPGETSASLLAALEQAVDAVVMIDGDNLITYFNTAAELMWGMDRRQVIGSNVKTLMPGQDGRRHVGYVAANTTSGLDRIVGNRREVRITRSNGKKAWVAFSLSRFPWAGATSYMALARDVTAEVEQREHLALMSQVADTTGRVVIVTDRRQRIVYVNNAFAEVFGFSRDEAIGCFPGRLLAGKYTDRDVLLRLQGQIQADGHGRQDCLAYDKSGNEIWIEATVNTVRDEHGKIRNMIAVLSDITETKQIHSLQHDILEALAGDLPVQTVMGDLCRWVETIAPNVLSTVLHVDSNGRLHTLAAPQLPASFTEPLDGLAIGPDVASHGTSAFRGTPVLVTDIATDPLWNGYRAGTLEAGLIGCWSTPIKAKDGRVIGALAFYFRDQRGPTAWHQTIVDACVHLCALAIERHEARTEIAWLAYYDTLTSLPNRVQLHRLMTRQIDSSPHGERVAVVFLDIDHFKDVNDTLGHQVGDDLLVGVANRLQAQIRPGDTLSRQGGDEFVLVLPNCDEAGATLIVSRILAGLATPFQLGTRQVQVSASMGISIFPDHATDIDSLLKHADAAMYKAKQAGRATFRFYSADMNRLSEERLALTSALRDAVSRGALRLHYQPQIRAVDGTVYGAEALARWYDPVLGEVSPAKFIPLAEDCGLIEQIGVWSLREACRQMAAWRQAKLNVPCVSVNLSPISFLNDDLATVIADIIADNALPPEALMLEITESVVMSENSTALPTMEKIRESGVGLSMDDFGTGYSSLNRLAHLPIRELKIDRSFMCNIESEASALAITTAVVRVGQSLNMTVVAEGVETEGQRRILTELGCDVIQGFLYSPALSVADFESWMRAHNALDPATGGDMALSKQNRQLLASSRGPLN